MIGGSFSQSGNQKSRTALAFIDKRLYRDHPMLGQHTVTRQFSALGDATRYAIVQRLSQGEQSVSELTSLFSLTQPTITSHLNVLEKAGLIERRKAAQKRIARLKPDAILELGKLLDAVGRQWSARLDRLAAYAAAQTDKTET
jgi:DNA-binding transcriptional ArsR family regulator